MKLDSLLASSSSSTIVDHSFAFDQASNSSEMILPPPKPSWNPWSETAPSRPIASNTNKSYAVDSFIPPVRSAPAPTPPTVPYPLVRHNNNNIHHNPSTSNYLRNSPPPVTSFKSRGSPPPPPSNWGRNGNDQYNNRRMNWDPYTRPPPPPPVVPVTSRYSQQLYSAQQVLSNLSFHLSDVRSHPEMMTQNGDRIQIKTHEQIHSTLTSLYHSPSPSAQDSARALTFTYNLYVEIASFLSFLPHPITPFKLFAVALLLTPSPLGDTFKRMAVPQGGEGKLRTFQARLVKDSNLEAVLSQIIEVSGMLSNWWEPDNWHGREQWSIWLNDLRKVDFFKKAPVNNINQVGNFNPNRSPNNRNGNAPQYHPMNQSNLGHMNHSQMNSNLSANRPRGSIPNDSLTARPLLNSRPSISSSSPARPHFLNSQPPKASTSTLPPPVRSHTKRPSPIPRTKPSARLWTTRPSWTPERLGKLPDERRNPEVPPILPPMDYTRGLALAAAAMAGTSTAAIIAGSNLAGVSGGGSGDGSDSNINSNRTIAQDRPKRLGPLEMKAWIEEDEDVERDVGRSSKRVRRAVSKDSSDGSFNGQD